MPEQNLETIFIVGAGHFLSKLNGSVNESKYPQTEREVFLNFAVKNCLKKNKFHFGQI